ncbi:MAG: rod shape-determining protein MreC [Rectinemataceae bacterium]|nr:rod shape-determining protein MreC [Rectinemataceae bacterium]
MSGSGSKSGNRQKNIIPPILLVFSLLILSMSTNHLESAARDAGLTVTGFFQRGFAGAGNFVSGLFTSIGELKHLRKEYNLLLLKLEKFDNLERDFADIRMENERLKEQLGFSELVGFERISARIIAKDPESRYLTLTIDQGSADGVKKNMAVVAFQGGVESVVGKVVAVGTRTSMVIPINDTRSFVAARISTTRNEGLVTGQGSEYKPLLLKYISKSAVTSIQFGDLVVTSGYESVFPPDIAIGRVKKINTPDYLPSAEIELDRALDFSRLEYVFVIRKSTDETKPSAGIPTDGEGKK